jgi:serine/threonine-protein kinase RsbW
MGARESDLDRVTRTLIGRKAVSQSSDVARDFAAAQWLSPDETARLCIIIEEWVANLFDHGGLGAKDKVELSLESEPEGIRVTITDLGKPFDPRHLPLDLGAPKAGGGAGAGIGIMRAWAELEAYEAGDGGNRLILLMPVTWA